MIGSISTSGPEPGIGMGVKFITTRPGPDVMIGSIKDYRTRTDEYWTKDPEYGWVESRTTGPKQLQSLLLNKNPNRDKVK